MRRGAAFAETKSLARRPAATSRLPARKPSSSHRQSDSRNTEPLQKPFVGRQSAMTRDMAPDIASCRTKATACWQHSTRRREASSCRASPGGRAAAVTTLRAFFREFPEMLALDQVSSKTCLSLAVSIAMLCHYLLWKKTEALYRCYPAGVVFHVNARVKPHEP